MPVFICLLRAVNLPGHNQIKMDALKALCESLKLKDVHTLLASGNVVFRAKERNPAAVTEVVQKGIERRFGIRSDIIVRTTPELRDIVARNPFAGRRGIEPGKLLVAFLGSAPAPGARAKLLQLDIAPEELHLLGRELYVYFPNGQGRPRLKWTAVDKAVQAPYTGRNWNTVTKLLALAESLEA